MKILVLAEAAAGKPSKMTEELMGLGCRLAQKSEGQLQAAVLGKEQAEGPAPNELIKIGADKIYLFPYEALNLYQIDMYAEVMDTLVKEVEPDLILLGHNMIGRELGPRLGIKTGAGCCMDCLGVDYNEENDSFYGTHPVYGGNVISFLQSKRKPYLFTIRARCQEPSVRDEARTAEMVKVDLNTEGIQGKTKIVSCTQSAGEELRLEDAKVIVAGGRGLGGPDGFIVLKELAKLLGGAVGASRAAVDAGWIETERQIGLTGKFVSPQLYIAVGISGAPQHMTGCAGARTIVCVNTNPEAAIFKRAHYGIVGDFRTVIPKIIPEFQKMLSN